MPVIQRIDGGRFCRVLREWVGGTVVIVAGGPSLTAEQVAMVRDAHKAGIVRCIVVNDGYLMAEFADVCYAADAKWHSWHRTKAEFKAFPGIKVSIENSMPQVSDQSVLILRNANAVTGNNESLSSDPCAIGTGSNSSFQALNIAVLTGASRILLLGVDGKDGPGGKRHHFGDHPDKSAPPYDAMRAAFKAAVPALKALGIEVLNCSPGSAVECFPLATLDDALAGRSAPPAAPAPSQSSKSTYVLVSELLRTRDATHAELLATFGERDAPGKHLSHALGKGIKKGTFKNIGNVWRHASRVVADS